jgi:hypothetical protein
MGLPELDDTLERPQAVEGEPLTVLPGRKVEIATQPIPTGGKLEVLNLPRLGIPALMHSHIFVKHCDGKQATMEHGVHSSYQAKIAGGQSHEFARRTAEFGSFLTTEHAKHLIERAIHERWEHGIGPWFLDVETISRTDNAEQALEVLVQEINRNHRNHQGGAFFKVAPLRLEFDYLCADRAGEVLTYRELERSRGARRETPAREDSFVIRVVLERIHRDHIAKRIRMGDLSPDFHLPSGHNHALFVKAAYPILPREVDLRRVRH